MPIASTPDPPYVAVIFTSVRTSPGAEGCDDGYAAAAAAMEALVASQDGFLGLESARNDIGITVSYWATLAAAQTWKGVAEHVAIQQIGKQQWYASYQVRIATVTRQYGQP